MKIQTPGSCHTVTNAAHVALVIAPEKDYHWFRQNPDGTWSQKMEIYAVTNKQNFYGTGDKIIWDPESVDLGEYSLVYDTNVKYYAVTSTSAFLYDLPPA